MSAKWPTVPLEELCADVSYGFTASAKDSGPGPQFLRITDIARDTLDWGSVPYCIAGEAQVQKYQLMHGDIVVARTGATVGYAKCLQEPPEAIFASYLVRFRVARSTQRDLLATSLSRPRTRRLS